MQIVIPPELVKICDVELSTYVTNIWFTKYQTADETLYFADHFEVKPSDNEVWEEARNIQPAPTRITIEGALFRLAKNSGVIVAQVDEEKKPNDEVIADYCCLATGKYIDRILNRQIEEGKI